MSTLSKEQQALADILIDEPYLIGVWAGFEKLGELHNKWLKKMLYGIDDLTLLAHRGSYKTTTLSVFLALHMLIKPSENVILFRKTDTDVAEILAQVAKITQIGAMQELSKAFYGKPMLITRMNSGMIDTSIKKSIKGAPQIAGMGIGTSITGKHADVVVTDDIVNRADRYSKAERLKTNQSYMELQNIKNRGGRIINTGTPWHKEDAISTLMPNIEKYDCYSTGLMSKEQIADVRSKMTDSLFSANYELKHIADSDALFKNPQFTDKQELLYGCIGHIDAGYGGGDSTAFTMLKQQPDGTFVAFGKRWQKHVDECLPAIKELHKAFRCGSIACEKNADKGYLAKELRGMGIPTDLYSENTNKFIKISTYLVRDWKNIKWLDITDPEYIGEILDYTEYAEHDDCPDSIASLLRKFENRVVVSHLKGGL